MSWNLLYALDLFAILIFVASYYRNCYRRGYRIDFWHANLFLYCVLPNLIMLPLARSDMNAVVLGQDFGGVITALPNVFLITLLGYFSVLAGGSLWRFRLGLGLRKKAIQVLGVFPRCSLLMMSSRNLLLFQSLLCFLLQILILAIYFAHDGFGFNLRAFAIANPAVRPVVLVISSYSAIIASVCLARYVERKERILLACTLLLTFGLVFFGARGNLLGIYLNVSICYLVQRGRNISLFRIIALTCVIVMFVLYLGLARSGEYSLGVFFNALAALLLYGDTFSDLRDFAWVYSSWNHVFWTGKTYLAALLAFIPRVASNFRDTWGLGAATAATAGLDPQVHPGLRPGIFGEGFLNFGILGVICIGLIFGLLVRRVDIDVKRALASQQPSMTKAVASTSLLEVALVIAITAGFSSLYILIGIYIFSWFCLRVANLVHSPGMRPSDAHSTVN
jgi:oligosaccharide repeat unit polymerase